MKRDKIISVRVNEELYNEVQKIISERTQSFTVYYRNTTKNIYEYHGAESKSPFGKFTVADIIENAFKEFIKT